MNWASAADFFAMGGYGLYVWGSFGVCALAVAVELSALSSRRRALFAEPDDGEPDWTRTSNES